MLTFESHINDIKEIFKKETDWNLLSNLNYSCVL